MEWCIPINTFQVENVQLGAITRGPKPIVPLAYYDRELHFPSLSFLLPLLSVKSYDTATGRLVLSLSESAQALSKLQILQDMLLTAVNSHYKTWYPGSPHRKPNEIRAGFQPMITGGELHLYCPIYEDMAHAIPVYMGGVWSKGKPKVGTLAAGKSVRIAIRLYGISFHMSPESSAWSGRFRLQHKIIGVLVA